AASSARAPIIDVPRTIASSVGYVAPLTAPVVANASTTVCLLIPSWSFPGLIGVIRYGSNGSPRYRRRFGYCPVSLAEALACSACIAESFFSLFRYLGQIVSSISFCMHGHHARFLEEDIGHVRRVRAPFILVR